MQVKVTHQNLTTDNDKLALLEAEILCLKTDDAVLNKAEQIVRKYFDCKVYNHILHEGNTVTCMIHMIGKN